MALVKIKEINPDYANALGEDNIVDCDVYSDVSNEKIGTVEDILIDEENGYFRYFILDIGAWILGKKVLLPVDYARINFGEKQVFAKGFTKEQAEQLPQFDESLQIDSSYEEQVSTIYPPRSMDTLNTADPLGNPASSNTLGSPTTIDTLTSLSAPSTPSDTTHSPEIIPKREDYPTDQRRS